MKTIRQLILLLIIGLVLSGVTAFPLHTELAFLEKHRNLFPAPMANWITQVHDAVQQSASLVWYGTDWLAFAHLVIALFFVPVYVNPVAYRLNVMVGMVASLLIFPLAFICGPIRGIPFFHQLIDCSFGLFAGLLFYLIHQKIKKLAHENNG